MIKVKLISNSQQIGTDVKTITARLIDDYIYSHYEDDHRYVVANIN